MRLACLFLLTLSLYPASAQHRAEPCGFDTWLRSHTREAKDADRKIAQALVGQARLGAVARHDSSIKTIPVVVHVIHTGGAENITDAQIQRQIAILNEDFRKKPATPGFGSGVDTRIEFCLAKRDPQGRCTDGIVRVNSPLANHQTFQRSQLKQLSFWDNTRYLNMYVVKNINNGSGTAGYASFPGGPADEDGIVVRHDYFGASGTAGGTGRTTTHEIGHWFGLYHTFQNGCGVDTCMDGDQVCDTPPVALPNFNCALSANSCRNDNRPDQVRNYLDYTPDACKNIFTAGQRDRMHAALAILRSRIWSDSNVTATGCDSGFATGPCNVIADFTTLTQVLCKGARITFFSRSQNKPLAFSWSFPGGNPASSTQSDPTVIYDSAGVFPVRLRVSGALGSDSLFMPGYITVGEPPMGQGLPYLESFEGLVFPPVGITIENPDTGVTWGRDTLAFTPYGLACAKINNLINTNYGQSDALALPSFDFTTLTGTPRLSFGWAYARSDPSYSDELVVLASRDCGVTWNQVFYRTGNGLVTGPTQTTPYIPDSSTVWRNAVIDLSAYRTDRNVRIKIVNVTDGGNNLYIDRIAISQAPTALTPSLHGGLDFSLYPNPAQETITLNLSSVGRNAQAELVGPTGQTIKAWSLPHGQQAHILRLPPSLPKGVYLLRVKAEDRMGIQKLVVEPR